MEIRGVTILYQGSAQDAPLRHLCLKIAEGAKKKKNLSRWARGRADFFNQKMTKSDFRDVVLAF